jgi:hypothetical protein
MDYPLQYIINRLKGIAQFTAPKFGQYFDDLIDNWTEDLSTEIPKLDVHSLTIKSDIIQDLKREFEQRNKEYNQKIELDRIREQADFAWNLQNYKQFIALMKGRVSEFPDSYLKKISIAKKRI